MSEEIGKHKGAVETLLHEKKELSRILQIVDSQLERHIKALEEAGVDTDQFIKNFQEQSQKRQQAQQQQRQADQKKRSQGQQSQRNQNSGSRRSSSNKGKQDSSSSSSSDDGKDMEDYFEEDDETRDFSPR